MKHNAFSRNTPTLYRVWAPDKYPPEIHPPDGSSVFVLWSPILKQWIMSITTPDYRYDAFVGTRHFQLDPALQPADAPKPDGPKYFLDQLRGTT